MRLRDKIILAGIVILTAFAASTLFWPAFGDALDREEIKLGLDLEGGAHLVYEADFSELPEDQDPDEAMKGVVAVIEKRVDAYGVSEPVIRRMGDDRVLVQLPEIEDIEEARRLIGETALIKFREFRRYIPDPIAPVDSGTPVQPVDTGTPAQIAETQEPVQPVSSGTNSLFVMRLIDDDEMDLVKIAEKDIIPGEDVWEAVPAVGTIDGEEIELTSQYFSGKVEVMIRQTGRAEIQFDWNSTGADLFWEITSRLASLPEGSVERSLGIFVGDEYESSPHVNEPIRDSGVITGMSLSEAKQLKELLNAGRIDVPLHEEEYHFVDPTLGEDFVDWSVQAGVIGLLLIILFLVLYYRLPGAMAGLALLIYSTLVMAVYQLWPVTLTLAGIAGFILSIGMAVDANVLIFERMKEEIRMGRTLRAAVEVGFNRAWPAIRDSNISTFITCGILYWMGSSLTVPSVQGFALTLFIGVAISMFSAIVITKTFLRLIGNTGLVDRQALFIASTRGLMLSREGR